MNPPKSIDLQPSYPSGEFNYRMPQINLTVLMKKWEKLERECLCFKFERVFCVLSLWDNDTRGWGGGIPLVGQPSKMQTKKLS
jgi:hypothetical protein